MGEPGQDHRPGGQAAAEDQVIQEADRGGGGDRRHQPGQVQEGSAGLRGGGGAEQAVRGQHRQVQEHQGCLGNDPGTNVKPNHENTAQTINRLLNMFKTSVDENYQLVKYISYAILTYFCKKKKKRKEKRMKDNIYRTFNR